jgi:hypothetical protein
MSMMQTSRCIGFPHLLCLLRLLHLLRVLYLLHLLLVRGGTTVRKPLVNCVLHRREPSDIPERRQILNHANHCTSQYLCAEGCLCMAHCAFNCSWTFLVHYPHVLDHPEPSRHRKQAVNIALRFNI